MPAKERASLRILILEDDPRDAELEAHALRRVDPACAVQVVDSRGTFTHALDSFAPDVILSDSGVAGFGALDALHLLQSSAAGHTVTGRRRHCRGSCCWTSICRL
jgi:CheY-like chemotaxis protein